MKIWISGFTLLLSIILTSNVFAAKLSKNSELLLQNMTAGKAQAILAKYIKPEKGRAGLCLIGIRKLTKLESSQPVRITGTIINFVGYYAKLAGISNLGTAILIDPAFMNLKYKSKLRNSSVDTATLKKITVVKVNKRVLSRCSNLSSGYLVAPKPKKRLPDSAEIALNAVTVDDLDQIMAALKFFSPKAKIKGKF